MAHPRESNGRAARVPSCVHIGGFVSNHDGGAELERELVCRTQKHAWSWFSARASILGNVKTEVGTVEDDAGRRKYLLNAGLHGRRLVRRDQPTSNARLIAHDNQAKAHGTRFPERFGDIGKELHQGGIPRVADVANERAVAVEQERPRGHSERRDSVPVVERLGTSGKNSMRPP